MSGPSGAAAKLGLPGSTLESKIRSLKINKKRLELQIPQRIAFNNLPQQTPTAQIANFRNVAKIRNLDGRQTTYFQKINIGTVIAITGVCDGRNFKRRSNRLHRSRGT